MTTLSLEGGQFGRLTVIERVPGISRHRQVLLRCLCSCGREIEAVKSQVLIGRKKSCGCLLRQTGSKHWRADNRPILDRLAERSYIVLATGCKIWNGKRDSHFGHGVISVAGKRTKVHRAAWSAERGPIPDGLDCLHDCPGGDNPACWNVDHLWLGTQRDNNADRDQKGRQVSLKGEAHGHSKLTAEAVLAIRADDRVFTLIAPDYGISVAYVGHIKRRLTWGHLP